MYDLELHFCVSFAIAGLVAFVMSKKAEPGPCILFALAMVTMLGVSKEFLFDPVFTFSDVFANTIGASIGAFFSANL